MKSLKTFTLALFASFALLFTGTTFAADPYETIAEEALVQMDRMANAVLSVTDKATADKAVAELLSVADDLKKIAAKAKGLGQPSDEIKAKIEAKMKAKTEEIQKKMETVPASLAKAGPEAAEVLGKGMEKFGAAMEEVGKAFEEADKK